VLHPTKCTTAARGPRRRFAYRIAYVDPTLVQAQLGGSPLPFVPIPWCGCPTRSDATLSPVWDLDDVLDEMALVRSERRLPISA